MKKGLKIIALSLIICSCGDDSGEPKNDALALDAAVLLSPANNATCHTGEFVSDTESNVKFEWTRAKNATTYAVVVNNLSNNTSETLTSGDPSITAKLLHGVEYSWSVISKSSKSSDTNKSEEWRFFHSREAEKNHAPFPAHIIGPKNDDTISGTSIALQWEGKDNDNDIKSFDVFFGTENPPVEKLGSTDVGNMEIEMLLEGTKYYWYVVTEDTYGNKTSSQINSFSIVK